MSIRTSSTGLCLSLMLAGCAFHPQPQQRPDFFAEQNEFAAAREAETQRFKGIGYDAMLAHVAESLLDLDCSLQETNKQLGVISAGSGLWLFRPASFTTESAFWADCAGHWVTVVVAAPSAGELEVRASFIPADPRVDLAFQLLLEKSIAQASME
jgi:hypothetical protein